MKYTLRYGLEIRKKFLNIILRVADFVL